MRWCRLFVGSVLAFEGAALVYLFFGRRACLTWGSTEEELGRSMPGDELLPEPEVLATRSVTIDAPAASIWPWLMQMGSGRGGVYTYDWIENLFGLDMHSINEIRPEFQDCKVGDAERLGKSVPVMRVNALNPEQSMCWPPTMGPGSGLSAFTRLETAEPAW